MHTCVRAWGTCSSMPCTYLRDCLREVERKGPLVHSALHRRPTLALGVQRRRTAAGTGTGTGEACAAAAAAAAVAALAARRRGGGLDAQAAARPVRELQHELAERAQQHLRMPRTHVPCAWADAHGRAWMGWWWCSASWQSARSGTSLAPVPSGSMHAEPP